MSLLPYRLEQYFLSFFVCWECVLIVLTSILVVDAQNASVVQVVVVVIKNRR